MNTILTLEQHTRIILLSTKSMNQNCLNYKIAMVNVLL